MRLLLIEDSPRLSHALTIGLRKLGHAVDAVADGKAGLDFARLQSYDAIVLDLMLPGMDGLSILSALRREGKQTHVLILSAKDRVEDRVRGLQLGADDYLVKPFAFDELCARLNALARRTFQAKNPEIALGPLQINSALREVRLDGRALALTAGEYAVLERLVLRRGQVLSKDQLLEAIHGSESFAGPNVVEVMICNLRRKLGPGPNRELIQTRRGHGYVIP